MRRTAPRNDLPNDWQHRHYGQWISWRIVYDVYVYAAGRRLPHKTITGMTAEFVTRGTYSEFPLSRETEKKMDKAIKQFTTGKIIVTGKIKP